MPPIVKFLIVIVLLIGSAVYFHFNREAPTYSKTLFGAHKVMINIPNEQHV